MSDDNGDSIRMLYRKEWRFNSSKSTAALRLRFSENMYKCVEASVFLNNDIETAVLNNYHLS